MGAVGALTNAVNDALAPHGVMLTEQPLTPEKILRALREPKGENLFDM